MFGILENLTKAAIGVVIETPIAIAADVVTLGGALNDKDKPYTADALENVFENIKGSIRND